MLVRWRFWTEVGLGALSVTVLLLTVVWPDWIEAVFGLDPDGGNGGLEAAIVVVLAICAVAAPTMARRELTRARRADARARI